MQLITAVTAQRSENVTGQALGMHSHQNRLMRPHIAHYQRHMFLIGQSVNINDDPENTILRRQIGFTDPFYISFGLPPVFDQALHRNDFYIVCPGDLFQGFAARHFAVFIHDFAHHTDRR